MKESADEIFPCHNVRGKFWSIGGNENLLGRLKSPQEQEQQRQKCDYTEFEVLPSEKGRISADFYKFL